jgi:uncharacterized protein
MLRERVERRSAADSDHLLSGQSRAHTVGMLQTWIVHWVDYCTQHFLGVIAAALLLVAVSTIYTARHFAIDTNINDLLSAKLPWRQREIALHANFPQTVGLILVDVEAPTPEGAEAAARTLEQGLSNKPDLFRSVRDEQDSPFIRRNALLFLTPNQVARTTGQLANARPMIGELDSDPSLRGLVEVLVGSLDYAKQKNQSLDEMADPLNAVAATLECIGREDGAEFSWKTLLQAKDGPQPSELHRVVEVWPVLDDNAVEPGGRATAAIREIVSQLGLHAKFGADVSLTGPVPISDSEFAAVQDRLVPNSVVTGVIVLTILWLALGSVRLVAAVVVNLAAGLAITAAGGILAVRRIESDIANVCDAVRRPRRRFRHSVHYSLSSGAPRD